MGSRARRSGITNAALRAARAAARERDEEAAAIAQRVYETAVSLKDERAPEPLPLAALAPLLVAAETVAPAVCKLAGLPVLDEMAHEVAAYLVSGFREMAVMLDPEHFEAWRERSDEMAAGGSDG